MGGEIAAAGANSGSRSNGSGGPVRTSTRTNGWVQTRTNDGQPTQLRAGEDKRRGWESWEGQLVPMGAGEDEHEDWEG